MFIKTVILISLEIQIIYCGLHSISVRNQESVCSIQMLTEKLGVWGGKDMAVTTDFVQLAGQTEYK